MRKTTITMKKIILLFTILPILAFAQVSNNTFDSDISNWDPHAGGNISWESSDGNSANGSLKIDVGGANNTGARVPNGSLNNGSGDYTFSAWIKGTAGNQVRLDLFELGINQFNGGTVTTLATSNWQFVEHTFTGLDDANGVSLRIINRTPSSSILVDDVSFVGGLGLSTSELDYTTINVYPNPAKNILNISNAVNINKVFIYEITGKLVVEELNRNHKQIDVSKLNSGIYLLKVQDENDNMLTKRFIKE